MPSKFQTTFGTNKFYFTVVVRACEDMDFSLGCSDTKIQGVETEMCFCATDLCNGSSFVTARATLTAFVIGLACLVDALGRD